MSWYGWHGDIDDQVWSMYIDGMLSMMWYGVRGCDAKIFRDASGNVGWTSDPESWARNLEIWSKS